MTFRHSCIVFVFALGRFVLQAQSSVSPPPDERFKVDLLVVVAHPDDETEIGAYLARAIFEQHKKVAVVFGTRGNGGGNAAGQEQSMALGSIREIEARKALAHFGVLDVWFLNGLDTAGQNVLDSLETWDHGDSLGRLVRLVRLTRPSVLVTWLPEWVAGENHGDHQAAGVIATEAFDMAGDPTVFGEQLATPRNRYDIKNLTEGLRPWQPEKIYYISDASHTEFLHGKGPAYSSTDVSPSHAVSYAKLAAEECAFHLTQDDTGQMARTALAKNDMHFFETPVLFVLGKSNVPSTTTGDLFEGVQPSGVAYHRPPGFVARQFTAPEVELGDPWRFYKQFWQAHGLENLSQLVAPEIQARYDSLFTIPLSIENPTDNAVSVDLFIDLPEGWTFRYKAPSNVSVGAHQSVTVPFAVKTTRQQTSGWQNIAIDSKLNGVKGSQIRIRTELDAGAMPQ